MLSWSWKQTQHLLGRRQNKCNSTPGYALLSHISSALFLLLLSEMCSRPNQTIRRKCDLLFAKLVKKECGNKCTWSGLKNRQAHWNLSKNTLPVLYIWATYISNHCALCNASLLIFKHIPLWSNYNWAFICFVPGLRGIDAVWRELSEADFTSVPETTGRI